MANCVVFMANYVVLQSIFMMYYTAVYMYIQWSYGITCWEVFSLGHTPYATVPNHEVLKYVEKGNRLHKPIHCPDKM